MLPALATFSDFAARFGTDADATRVQAILLDASTVVRSAAGLTWVDEDNALSGVPDEAVTVTLWVAKRAYDNPDGYVSETLDGYSYRAADGTLPGVYLTKSEAQMIRRAVGAASTVRSQRAVRPGLLETANATEFVEVEGSDEPMPWAAIPWWDQ